MLVSELIAPLQTLPQDAVIELAEEGSMELSAECITLYTYPTAPSMIWVGALPQPDKQG